MKDLREISSHAVSERTQTPDIIRHTMQYTEYTGSTREMYQQRFLLSRIDRATQGALRQHQNFNKKSFEYAAGTVKECMKKRFEARINRKIHETDEDLLNNAIQDAAKHYHAKFLITDDKREEKQNYLVSLRESVRQLQPVYEEMMSLVSMPTGAEKYSLGRKLVEGQFGTNTCVPATVEMILNDNGIRETADNIRKGVKHNRTEGTRMADVVPFLHQKGLTGYQESFFAHNDKDTLRQLLQKQNGQPCILQYAGIESGEAHAVVVDSIDHGDRVVLRDPIPHIGAIRCSLDEVVKRWSGRVIADQNAITGTIEWQYGDEDGSLEPMTFSSR